ncbi:uncharacterized protein EDB91DRAFT_653903 [Suillus paluster]|uniref:uncharacterized protein n=1 Tax=Suillus paluster TaxID=48578 RepID=UPI001B86090F|nr:uncharacterized protein EDB91DRAFT_653903 [Suillus paluster]KAG1733056.1 hypothetical protein EDB91DRAFT_653903 [Suillus paluster]
MSSDSAQDITPQLDLGDTFGALFIAAIIAALLFGVTNVQAFVYFQTHRGTGTTFYKLVVIFLWTLDALHLALIVHGIYYYLVINYANIAALPEIEWSSKLQIPIDTVIVWGVNFLYVQRIWIVNRGRSRTLPITVGIIVVLGLGTAINFNWAAYRCHTYAELLKIEWANYLMLGTITSLDILIASSLCYLLTTSRTGFTSTDSFVTRLMSYTISTGCVTSISSLTAIITCAVMPKNFVFLGVEFLVAKIYINSYIALLNAQYYTQAESDNFHCSELHISNGVYRPELCLSASQSETFTASRKNAFKHPSDVVHPARFKRSSVVTIEMDSCSTV